VAGLSIRHQQRLGIRALKEDERKNKKINKKSKKKKKKSFALCRIHLAQHSLHSIVA
jgi:hypothetical protein